MHRLCVLISVLALAACADSLSSPPLTASPDKAAASTRPVKKPVKKPAPDKSPTDKSPADKPVSDKPAADKLAPDKGPDKLAPAADGENKPPERPAGDAASPARPPIKVVGLDESAVRQLFGPPAGESERPPARLWSYQHARCRLELSLYLDVASRNFRVLTYNVVPQGSQPLPGNACISALTSHTP